MRLALLVVLLLAVGCASAGPAGSGAGARRPAESTAGAPAAAGTPTAAANDRGDGRATSASGSGAGGAGAPEASGAAEARPVARAVEPPRTVRIANVGLAAQGPTYLAIEAGYFTELGLNVEVVNMNSTNDIVALLTNDQLDVGFGAINPAFFNAAARGVGVRMVADHGSNLPGRSTVSLAVRNDLLERKPWSGYGDLRGAKLAVQQVGTQTEYYVELMLQRGGLQPSDVELIALPFPDMALAFANKAIDAGIFNEPWA